MFLPGLQGDTFLIFYSMLLVKLGVAGSGELGAKSGGND